MRHVRIHFLVMMAGWTLLPMALHAQYPKVAKRPPGALAGEIVNAKGAPVEGALILWQVADGAKPHVLHSDAHGHFRVAPLHSGLYDVRASKGELSSKWSRNLLVKPGGDTAVTLRLIVSVAAKRQQTNLAGSSQKEY